MTKINTISNTAFYCCGVRMEDAQRTWSVCNDHFAKRFMDEQGLAFYEPFRSETMPNISNITRCRIIDDMLRCEIEENAGASFTERPENPEEIFINNSYIQFDRIAMVKHATQLGLYWNAIKMPKFAAKLLFDVFMKDLDGYAVNRFRYG